MHMQHSRIFLPGVLFCIVVGICRKYLAISGKI